MRCNLHTHTNFCDGANSAEQMVLAAISQGFAALGFTGHCLTDFDRSYCMDAARTAAYRAEIARLQQRYGDRLAIFCGIEQDRYGAQPEAPYDYAIGSVHYVKKNGRYLPIDETVALLEAAVQTEYNGDPYCLLEDYFRAVTEIGAQTEIVGHFDLVTKFLERTPWFDAASSRYRALALGAVEQLLSRGPRCFEINTGAMARGYRTAPYPAPWILRRIRELGGVITITSDCHNAAQLSFGYETAAALARQCGFSKQVIRTTAGWELANL